MVKISINKFLKFKRGQLNIVEVVVSATIILVLTISIAQLGVKLTVSDEENSTTTLRSQASQILNYALKQGVLRNLTYTNVSDPDFANLKAQMIAILDSGLAPNVEYSLYQNTIDGDNFRLILGLNPIPSYGTRTSSSIFVGGIVNTAITSHTYYIITLLMITGD